MKICSQCKEEKSDESFSFKKNGMPGLKSACKACHAADVRERYAADPAPRIARSKELRKDPEVRRKINKQRNALRRKNPALELWRLAKVRARQKNLAFDIDVSDVVVPEVCPVLGIRLEWGCSKRQLDCSPTVDRVIPDLGYVKTNVRVISWRANRIKSDATAGELAAVLAYVSSHAWPALGVAVTVAKWSGK